MTIFIQTRDEKEVFGFGSMKVNWTDFPVMNMHPHAWQLINTAHLLGISFSGEGITIAPSIPFDEYEFKTNLLGFKRSQGMITGWYAPKKAGTWRTSIQLNPGEAGRCRSVEINGKAGTYHVDGDCINFAGSSSPGSPLGWLIRF